MSSGVPRKNQTYAEAKALTSRKRARRISPRMVPSTSPNEMEMTVNVKVVQAPLVMAGSDCTTNSQSNPTLPCPLSARPRLANTAKAAPARPRPGFSAGRAGRPRVVFHYGYVVFNAFDGEIARRAHLSPMIGDGRGGNDDETVAAKPARDEVFPGYVSDFRFRAKAVGFADDAHVKHNDLARRFVDALKKAGRDVQTAPRRPRRRQPAALRYRPKIHSLYS